MPTDAPTRADVPIPAEAPRTTDGPATDGPATDGPATDGPATDGPATDAAIAHERPFDEPAARGTRLGDMTPTVRSEVLHQELLADAARQLDLVRGRLNVVEGDRDALVRSDIAARETIAVLRAENRSLRLDRDERRVVEAVLASAGAVAAVLVSALPREAAGGATWWVALAAGVGIVAPSILALLNWFRIARAGAAPGPGGATGDGDRTPTIPTP